MPSHSPHTEPLTSSFSCGNIHISEMYDRQTASFRLRCFPTKLRKKNPLVWGKERVLIPFSLFSITVSKPWTCDFCVVFLTDACRNLSSAGIIWYGPGMGQPCGEHLAWAELNRPRLLSAEMKDLLLCRQESKGGSLSLLLSSEEERKIREKRKTHRRTCDR